MNQVFKWCLLVAVWLSGNIVGRINEVTLRRAEMGDRSRVYRLGI